MLNYHTLLPADLMNCFSTSSCWQPKNDPGYSLDEVTVKFQNKDSNSVYVFSSPFVLHSYRVHLSQLYLDI